MQLRVYLLSQWVILCFQYNFDIAKALIGQKVKAAKEGEYSYAACLTQRLALTELTVQKILCTAAAITQNHVLLTAHCIENRQKEQSQVIIGSVNLLSGRIYYPSWWISFQDWSTYLKKKLEYKVNDIAVIKLAVTLPNEITPIQLSPLSNADLYGTDVKTIGWGVTNDGVACMNLQKVKLNVLSHSECESKVKVAQGVKVKIQKTNLCTAARPFALINVGDSGGPVIFQNKIAGVNKATLPGTASNQDRVNTHVGIETYRTFILYVTNNLFVWF